VIGVTLRLRPAPKIPNRLRAMLRGHGGLSKKFWRIKSLRVGPKSSSTQTKLSEQETNRGEAKKSERVSGEIFETLAQPAAAIKPSESAFDNPTSRQKLEPFAG
jgi:hypothetical protein